MKVQKDCSTCEFNFGGLCTAEGKMVPCSEEPIEDCPNWGIDEQYLAQLLQEGPWYLTKPYRHGKRSLSCFLQDMEQDERGEAVELNLFDAIEEIYGVSTNRLADICGVSADVVGYARTHGAVKRRIPCFSHCLYIPEKMFEKFTSKDIPMLRECYKTYQINNKKPS